ncbi:hypothetical protein QJS04_geneDACA022092 [Acorus gramineus]|uniref:Squalene monooxygenase n=1 Tax=Acorus gramineus TaxID=55184 RepID=A0AAV9AZY8_ACOGR|nr:hypothetical protein QJS04_geneDACA022092 [Acorus gramineus]
MAYDCVEDIDSQRVLGYALFHDGKSIRLPYPLKKIGLDLLGKSFHNGRFIQRLREKAASLPSVQLDQGTVTSLLEENGIVKGVVYKDKTGGEYVARAHFTIVCDGCFSNLRRALCHPKPVASTINALAGIIYMVLSAPTDEAKNELRRACFDYLSIGGVFMSTSMALLSGLNSDPWNLVYHFFAVALYSIGRLLFPFPSPKRLWVGARLISGGLSIVVPIIKAEGMMQMFFPATL